MSVDSFPQAVVEEVGNYVYRLIDTRNGETFYVGKGKGQRVFDHARGVIGAPDQHTADPKVGRIHEIRALSMDVQHIIHRHGMSEPVAKEVEAALIDAYPGLQNKVSGSGSKERGARHVDEIILEYGAEEFMAKEPLILISIGRSWKERSLYEAVKGYWKLKIERAKHYNLVLAHVRGVVRGAYRPTQWMEASGNRIGFEGAKAEPEVCKAYVGKRVPARYRKRGAQTPCRYIDPQ